jgi:hypothetical protein
MKLTRRSVLGAIGTVGVGTGAAFGSGAFTSTTADRAVEVNVFGANTTTDGVVDINGLDGGSTQVQNTQEDIADTITNNTVDVLVDISSDSVGVRANSDDTLFTDGTELFPNPTGGNDSVYGQPGGDPFGSSGGITEANYVSLVANDVTIVFGGGSGNGAGVPPNSDLTYDPFFAFADPNTNGATVDFQTSQNTNSNQLLTSIGPNTVSSADNTGADLGNVINQQQESAVISTGTASQEVEDLDIVIG